MKKTLIVKIACLVFAAVLCCAALVSCATWDGVKEDIKTGADKITGTLHITPFDSPNISLTSAEVALSDVTIGNEMTRKLTATVLPDYLSADMKLVDWSVYWIENNEGDPQSTVDDFIKLDVLSDGSCEAYITPLRPFFGSTIGVKATTREGGFEAVCTVEFIGYPTVLNVLDPSNGNAVVDSVPCLGKGYTSFSVEPYNDFFEFICQEAAFPDIEIVKVYSDSQIVFSTGAGAEEVRNAGDFIGELFTVEHQDLTLSVNVKSYVELLQYVLPDGETVATYKAGAEDVTFYIDIREPLSGVVTTFEFCIVPTTEGVTLDQSTIHF